MDTFRLRALSPAEESRTEPSAEEQNTEVRHPPPHPPHHPAAAAVRTTSHPPATHTPQSHTLITTALRARPIFGLFGYFYIYIGPKTWKGIQESEATMRPSVSFYLYFQLCVFLGVACVVGVCVWNTQWHGGFAWDTSEQQFNWHPVLMVSGLVVLYGYGAVLYRVPLTWGGDKRPWKLAHAGLMLLALLLSIVGLCAVFQVHDAKHIPALYSIHSWVGICTVTLFATQWVVGFGGFLLPCSPGWLRGALKPLHMWLGASILTLSIAACISGINENLIFSLKGTTNGTQPYKSLPPEAVFANSLGVLIFIFGLVVLRILSNRNWERPEPSSQEALYRPLLQEEN